MAGDRVFLSGAVRTVIIPSLTASETGDTMVRMESSPQLETKIMAKSVPSVSVSPEKVIKHPLQNAWTLWFFKNDKSRSWEENQRQVMTVDTIEDFWSLYNHIEVASRLTPGSDYSLFKEGIFPDWEDARNAPGGRWLINLDRRQRSEHLDNYWLEILFFLIGEHAEEHSHQITGGAVNVRGKGDKVAIWLADAEESESIIKIGEMMKEKLGLYSMQKIGFSVHSEEKARGRDAKPRYYV